MPYNLQLSDTTPLFGTSGLSDGTVDNTKTSLTLIGRDYAGYGQFLNENFVYLLENFANTLPPPNPLKGQLWWDKSENILKVFTGNSWKISTGATSAPFTSPPPDTSAAGGDLWFDNTNSQLKVWTGSSGSGWLVVGPQSTGALQTTGAFSANVTDVLGRAHAIIQFSIQNTPYIILSKDSFDTSLSGFANIKAGLNFSTTATPSLGLSSQDTQATSYTLVQRDINGAINGNTITGSTINATTVNATTLNSSTFNGNLIGTVTGNVTATSVTSAGFTATSGGYAGTIVTANQPNITGLGNVINLRTQGTTNLSGTTNIVGYGTYNGSEIAVVGGGGNATFSSLQNTPIGNVTPSLGLFTTLQVTTSLTPTSNVTVDIGSPTAWWRNIYGTSVHAQYADLAERFHADTEYPAGTVVELGGPNEITKVAADLSDKVFGVISTNAAYLMNSGAGDDNTHPPVAMSGRVPVRVIGLISKGDRLVSAGNGIARAGKPTEITAWNVIGRSLVDKSDESEGIIEAIVKINS